MIAARRKVVTPPNQTAAAQGWTGKISPPSTAGQVAVMKVLAAACPARHPAGTSWSTPAPGGGLTRYSAAASVLAFERFAGRPRLNQPARWPRDLVMSL